MTLSKSAACHLSCLVCQLPTFPPLMNAATRAPSRRENALTARLTKREPYDKRSFFAALFSCQFASSVFEPSGALFRPPAAACPPLVCRRLTHRYQRCVPGKMHLIFISELFADNWPLAGKTPTWHLYMLRWLCLFVPAA